MNRQAVAPRPVISVPYLLLCILALSGVVSRPAHAAVREAWVRQHAGVKQTNDAANAVAIDAAGNVISTGTADQDCYTVKYSRSGTRLWQRSYNGPSNRLDQCVALAVDAAGDVVVTGSSARRDSHFYTAKYAADDGSVVWETQFPAHRDCNTCDPVTRSGADVVLDAEGNAIVIGSSSFRADQYRNSSFWVLKHGATDGGILSTNLYMAGGCYFCPGASAWDVAVGASKHVAVLGLFYDPQSSFPGEFNANYGIIQLGGSNSYQWFKRYDGPGVSIDIPRGIAVTKEGDVVVTGYTRSSNIFPYTGVTALHVAKFVATDGALLWEKRYTNAQPREIVADANDDIIVTGGSGGEGTNGFLTLKFSGVDGALLWETLSGNATNNPGAAQKLAVDSSGNVVVTGSSFNERGNRDIYTAKYAGTDGSMMWEIRYNGAADGNDTVRGLALGSNGLVAVSGESTGTNGVTSFTTILYQDELPSLTIALVPEGVRLRSVGVVGSTYQIERAPSVIGPWELIASPVATTSGLVEHVDTNRPPETAFYRVRKP